MKEQEIEIGDLVQLTGESWANFGLKGEFKLIVAMAVQWGDGAPAFQWNGEYVTCQKYTTQDDDWYQVSMFRKWDQE